MALKLIIPSSGGFLLWFSLAVDFLACSSFESFILVMICCIQSSVFLVSRFRWALQVVKECNVNGGHLSEGCRQVCPECKSCNWRCF